MLSTHPLIDISILADIADACYTEPRVKLEAVRDAMSKGQLNSKLWLIHHLMQSIDKDKINILIVGGWIALLSKLMFGLPHSKNKINHIMSLDIDPSCETFANALHFRENKSNKMFTAITDDMYTFNYSSLDFDIVINTSCEHIPNIQEWLDKIPDRKTVVLQSNDYEIPEHINVSKSLDDFKNKVKLHKTIYSSQFKFDMYTRYMIIGEK